MRHPFDWTRAYDDHLHWLWAVSPQLSKAKIASRLGISLNTLKLRQGYLDLAPRRKGRKTFCRTTSAEVDHDDAVPISECMEGSRLARNAVVATDELLRRLRCHHDLSEVITVVTRAQSVEQLPSWPFR